ncbi:hypothetical protein G6F65_017773 [Rhizopus arrhizus]|nr:hypothetical protein G6F65_017773 [Rhizopus arrhizus]
MQRMAAVGVEVVACAEIDLQVRRQLAAIGHALDVRTQAAAEHVVGTDPVVAREGVAEAARRRQRLVVIQVDPVVGHVGQGFRVQVVLPGDDVGTDGLVQGGIEVGAERAVAVVGTEFQAADVAAAIVERRIDVGGAELAFILQPRNAAVIRIQAQCEVFTQLLRDADVVVVAAFGQRNVVAAAGRLVGGAVRE